MASLSPPSFIYANDKEILTFIRAYKRFVKTDLGFEPTDDQAIRGLITMGGGQVPNVHYKEDE